MARSTNVLSSLLLFQEVRFFKLFLAFVCLFFFFANHLFLSFCFFSLESEPTEFLLVSLFEFVVLLNQKLFEEINVFERKSYGRGRVAELREERNRAARVRDEEERAERERERRRTRNKKGGPLKLTN